MHKTDNSYKPAFRRTTVLLALMFFFAWANAFGSGSELFNKGINLIPYPQEVVMLEADFELGSELSIVLDRSASEADRFAAEELAAQLLKEWGVTARIRESPSGTSILLTHKGVSRKISGLEKKNALQGYQLKTEGDRLTIRAKGDAGLFYGTQTLLQIIKTGSNGAYIPGMEITDWPDIGERACHYDTKHHQDKRSYVESFIRDLASYKINMLMWEWEDKFAYPSHPEIGAPGAFTMEEMQELTRYARQYHVQIVPLVQGLGHVSYILKWPQYNHLREIAASNWEFCPLKEGSYELLNELWQDAIEATPGSEYLHIGTDESYELGKGVECGCEAEVKENGKHALMTHFINKSAGPLIKKGRTVMAWSAEYKPGAAINPLKGMVLIDEQNDLPEYHKDVTKRQHERFCYDPNPGIEPLFLPYFYKLRGEGENEKEATNSLTRSYEAITSAVRTGRFKGMINTSWDDSGLHNQMWMMSFINSAEWAWSGSQPGLEEFVDKFFPNYYGDQSIDMKELYLLLNNASYYYYKSFERRVWHYGDIGKTHLPDMPRGDNLEYDEFWNREYASKIEESKAQLEEMKRAGEIIRMNQEAGIRNSYDLELFSSIVELVNHTCNTYLALSSLEQSIKEAHNQRYLSYKDTQTALEKAVSIIETNLSERDKVQSELISVWEKTRLAKGMSTADKEFFHQQDRARHFAFRRADMSYLICDEELLGLEEYLGQLKEYIASAQQSWMNE